MAAAEVEAASAPGMAAMDYSCRETADYHTLEEGARFPL